MTHDSPAAMLSARPNPHVARVSRHTLNNSLLNGLRTQCTVASKALKAAALAGRTATELIDPGKRLNPLIFCAQQDMRAALCAQDRSSVQAKLELLSRIVITDTHYTSGLTIRPRRHELNGVDMAIDSVLLVSDGDEDLIDNPPKPPGHSMADTGIRQVQDAMALISDTDPDLAAESGELLSEVVLTDGGPEGVTSLKFFGAAQIRLPRHLEGPAATLYVAEHLAHETSHLAMYAMMSIDPMLHNAHLTRYTSPLRSDLRPLYEVFHVTFVLARLTRLYTRIRRITGSPESEAAAEMQHKLFLDGYQTLQRHADLTDTGRRILDECHAMASAGI